MIRSAASFALLWTAAVGAQPLQPLVVYSEFRRVGADGEIVDPDRQGRPREILSPAVARNAFASYRLVVTPPPGKPFVLHIGENPESIVQVTLYRELPVKVNAKWMPDKLERVSLPASGYAPMPGTSEPPELKSVTYWMDVWVPAHAPVRRVRVEAQLNIGNDWIIYPLEVRVQSAVVPKAAMPTGALPPVLAYSAESALGPLQGYLCESGKSNGDGAGTIREMIRRNAAQDIALARKIEPSIGRGGMETALLALMDAPDAKTWCAARGAPAARTDPEVYLKIRDFLLKTSVK